MNTPTASPVILAHGDRPAVRIATPANAAAAEEYAAEEFRRHLYTMIGAGFCQRNSEASRGGGTAPAVAINDRAAAEAAGIAVESLALGPEAFHLETRAGSVYLLGGGPRGLLYGVYHLLETLGCRWFTPELTQIPRRARVELPAQCLTLAPAFEFRDMWVWDGSDPVWWVRNRMNGWYTPVPDYMGGHMTYGLFVHTFDQLVPPHEFFDAHPEYFSLVGGTRRRDGAQLCLSNPAVLRVATDRILEHMRRLPRATLFSVSQNDCDGYCECPACRAIADEEGSQSGPILRFVNAVAAETSRTFPARLIDTLAYTYSLDAPRLTKPHPNVRVRLCSIRCCQGHGYGTCEHPESRRFLRALEGWGRMTPQMYIWHYGTNFSNYPFPMPNLDELHANIGLYQKQGVYGIFMQGMGEEGGGGESMALRGYVLSKLMWNPKQPVWPLVDEFLAAYYGKAAPSVRAYLDTFHGHVREHRDVHPSLYDPPSHPLFAPPLLDAADRALAEGEQLAGGAARLPVRLLRHGLSYARLFRTCPTFRREGDRYVSSASDDDRRAFDAMVADWKRAGLQRIQEGAPLERSVEQRRKRLAAHDVLWLREGEQAVAVVPALGGCLLEWQAGGRQWLAPPDPDNHFMAYPMSEGYRELVQTGLYSWLGWSETYRAAFRKNILRLTVTLNRDITLARELLLAGGLLHIRSSLKNGGVTPFRCAWGAGLHLLMPDGGAVVRFDAAAGPATIAWADIPDGLGQALKLEQDRRPRGEWRVEAGAHRLTHQFGDAVTQVIVGKAEARHTLALDLRTPMADLAPGATLAIIQTLSIEGL